MTLEEEIKKAVRENRDLTVSKLAVVVRQPRAKVSAVVGSMAEKEEVLLVPVATGKVVRLLSKGVK